MGVQGAGITLGYRREDGRKGIRNKLLIIYTVDCSAHVAMKIQEHCQRYGWDADVVGQRSCQMHRNRVQALLAYCIHPNVGAVLVVGNGCECTSAQAIAQFAQKNGRMADWFFLQEAGGTEAGIEKGIQIAHSMFDSLEHSQQRVPFYLSDLIIGAKCGGSDFTSGLVANPMVGVLFDRLVDANGTCLFAEVNEALGLRDHLVGRGIDEKSKRELARVYDKAEESCRQSGQYFIRPGNLKGGLTTIEEKSMSSYAKSGSRPIRGALKIGQRPNEKGLWLFDEAPDEYFPYRLDHEANQGGDAAVLMLMNTAGCHVNLLITGRGHTCGTGISPTIKITANSETYRRMGRDIDFDASMVLRGVKSMDEAADDLLQLVGQVCSGRETNADRLGHRENEIWSVAQRL